ncbi:MAG: hypothetical protein A2268_06635 [Candidatus Raymondbacteria bacterium RifOxyA12_full_50_37]|uniref:DUF1343 domain-containing protein n=1 Tax=Candidatus Raymondbacteria bacterium RIFOXYD12_FULL_49_13 TaxID=1817890 RepID=A0A1F7F7N4_UNCRA|nr:MAG: hypothetical protein A2268_06635 [Candidatus Raymondbacteria bacterium RifOxyA12_full_50_37]OGJ99014.1 MAG: hypothetical protein A2350_06690 [Candidatus Raymondbacteria bacterium RifOxyB12_full_50_8]OGK02527.1 MAG: hypothetical protein A2519_12030 [Candidatus Raymondbacteria bacterium RIFOXYD12_FULL_49_13]OGP42118.1 MAG: hypothetical protein A2324_14905 [Candidatus Raymondbacteria bacterium RIFOXYB2_FULL_49_35]
MVLTGLDLAAAAFPKRYAGKRCGLLCHPASVNARLVHAVDALMACKKILLTALFGPQHGIRGETQANMIEWQGFTDSRTGLPVNSLYGSHRTPTPAMLSNIDALIVDLCDVGARYYTYIWTLDLCMEACCGAGKGVVVLDRPNPINGIDIEGPLLDETRFASFVGQKRLPVRHGLTIGEIARYLQKQYYPKLDLHVVPMKGWRRNMYFEQTGLPWVMPSPNMPTIDTTLVYPGMCLLEATILSEGRGTTRPFEFYGAPFIDPFRLARVLEKFALPGVRFRPAWFTPTFDKFKAKLCGGVQLHISNRRCFKPFLTGLMCIYAVMRLYPGSFRWIKPPYEYERKKMPIDILCGTDRIRKALEKRCTPAGIEALYRKDCASFASVRGPHLLYS